MEKTSFREYIANQAVEEKASPKKRKWRSIFAVQVVIAIVLGGIVWAFISSGNEQVVSTITNNIKYNIEYSTILQEANNIWDTFAK